MSRKNVFQLRLNDVEIELLKSRSLELGLSRSDYLRGLVELDADNPLREVVEPKVVSSFKGCEGSEKKSTPLELDSEGLSSAAIADMVKRQKTKGDAKK